MKGLINALNVGNPLPKVLAFFATKELTLEQGLTNALNVGNHLVTKPTS